MAVRAVKVHNLDARVLAWIIESILSIKCIVHETKFDLHFWPSTTGFSEDICPFIQISSA